MIRVDALTKHYGPVAALRQVSFEIGKGEVVGFLGPNGAGKTTTMKILTGYLFPDAGEAHVAGFDVLREPLEVKRRIGYLPENTPLYADMQVDRYLDFVGAMRGMPRTERRAAIGRAADACALHGVMKKGIAELSRGYRQRVGLAQALLHDPEILVLDEPTSGLDPNQIVEIATLIRRLGERKTILLSTHILPEVPRTCARVLIVHRGTIVADGAPDALAASGADAGQVLVTIEGDEAEIARELASIAGEGGVERLGTGRGGGARFALRDGADGRLERGVATRARERGWTVTELRREGTTLEDAFRRLTGGS